MRLLDSKTLELSEFMGSDVPAYAILSHTWGDEEVSFQEMMSGEVSTNSKAGYEKIRRCCDVALSDGFDYAWIDTCCIDKSSSAELSEAINSMYCWYQEALVCYVVLSDVSINDDYHHETSAFRKSRWFTRAWTLQELIVPRSVIFYSKEWKQIGTKHSLQELIADITGIRRGIISGSKSLREYSIAQKMSWASKRHATRREDIAYCLMGIFDVNMPLLYGEGDKAFLRLQEQILSASDDQTIFAWNSSLPMTGGSCFARTPAAFAQSTNIGSMEEWAAMPHTLTHRGVNIQVLLYQHDDILVGAVLNCIEDSTFLHPCMMLRRISSGTSQTSYARTHGRLRWLSDSEVKSKNATVESIFLVVDRSLKPSVPASLTAFYVETRGLRENRINFLGMSNYQTPSNTTASILCWPVDARQSHFHILHFQCRDNTATFDVVLKPYLHEGDLIPFPTAIAGPHSAYLFVEMHVGRGDTDNTWKGSDQIRWHQAGEGIWIRVNVRPKRLVEEQVTFEEDPEDPRFLYHTSRTYNVGAAFKVDISWDKPGDLTSYEAKTLEQLVEAQQSSLDITEREQASHPSERTRIESMAAC